ncbi:MAG: periplasmic heavy metal sensor [Bacteroidales bacterium]|nr:periplasmic heavy metal sensor [Bacteroidales bacterium]
MKIFTNKEVWIWALASLLVITIAILGTMLWQRYSDDNHKNPSPDLIEFSEKKESEKGYGTWREKMGCTPEQNIQLKELRDEFREASSGILNKLSENQQQIFEELDHENPDHEKLDRLATETGQLHADLRKETIRHMLAIKAVTAPEQYDKMAEMIQQWIFPPRFGHQQKWQHRHRKMAPHDTCE